MIDLALLRIIKYKEQFDKVSRYIPKSAIDKRTRAVTEDIRKYFSANDDQEKLDFPAFRSLFFTVYHKGLGESDIAYYNKLIDRMEDDVAESVKKNIINNLLELEFVTEVANVINDYEQGEDVEAAVEIYNLANTIRDTMERTQQFEFAGFEDSTIGESSDDEGMLWPLDIMNQTYRRIQGGDQYIVAARPGKGKTTLLTFINWSMAQQMDDNKCILWFNNESRRQRIMSRQIQSALNMTNEELGQLKAKNELGPAYIKAMGSADRVRVYDVHGKNNVYIEDIIHSVGIENIGGLVFDMLDNVKFPTAKDMREDQRLEQLYQWSRELAVLCDCPSFPTSQVSNEGADELFPQEQCLKDSKTGKQGACDGIIMLGSSADPMLQHTRGLSMPKTKSKRAGQLDMREEIIFDADRGRFK